MDIENLREIGRRIDTRAFAQHIFNKDEAGILEYNRRLARKNNKIQANPSVLKKGKSEINNPTAKAPKKDEAEAMADSFFSSYSETEETIDDIEERSSDLGEDTRSEKKTETQAILSRNNIVEPKKIADGEMTYAYNLRAEDLFVDNSYKYLEQAALGKKPSTTIDDESIDLEEISRRAQSRAQAFKLVKLISAVSNVRIGELSETQKEIVDLSKSEKTINGKVDKGNEEQDRIDDEEPGQ